MKKDLKKIIYDCKAFCEKYDTEYVTIAYRHDSEYHFGLGWTTKDEDILLTINVQFENPTELTISEIKEKFGITGLLKIKEDE